MWIYRCLPSGSHISSCLLIRLGRPQWIWCYTGRTEPRQYLTASRRTPTKPVAWPHSEGNRASFISRSSPAFWGHGPKEKQLVIKPSFYPPVVKLHLMRFWESMRTEVWRRPLVKHTLLLFIPGYLFIYFDTTDTQSLHDHPFGEQSFICIEHFRSFLQILNHVNEQCGQCLLLCASLMEAISRCF